MMSYMTMVVEYMWCVCESMSFIQAQYVFDNPFYICVLSNWNSAYNKETTFRHGHFYTISININKQS